jgi:hypothetical protein
MMSPLHVVDRETCTGDGLCIALGATDHNLTTLPWSIWALSGCDQWHPSCDVVIPGTISDFRRTQRNHLAP